MSNLPEQEVPEDAPRQEDVPDGTNWEPSRKVIAAAITGVASILASWIVTEAFDDVERGMVATLLIALVSAYTRKDYAESEGGEAL